MSDSFLGEFDTWVRRHFVGPVPELQHRGLWDGWVGARIGATMPYPGTEEESLGATCKSCDRDVNRSDVCCSHCGYVFPDDPDYPRKHEGTAKHKSLIRQSIEDRRCVCGSELYLDQGAWQCDACGSSYAIRSRPKEGREL